MDTDNADSTAGSGGVIIQPEEPAVGTGDVIWVDTDGTTTNSDGNDVIGIPPGGTEGQILKIVGGVPTWVADE